jgi:peroxiredoxin
MMAETTLQSPLLQPGHPAPHFTLPVSSTESVSLADYLGKPVILVFYPADWSPDCGDQLTLYNELLDDFAALGARLLAIAGDSVYSHMAFARARNFHFPLLADYLPRGEVGRRYGAFEDEAGMNQRALFVLDSAGIIQWSHVSPHRSIVPGADGILAALEALPENATRKSS